MFISTIYQKMLRGTMAAVVVLLSSCYQPNPVEIPSMSEEELLPVLRDIHLAEALLTEIINKEEKDSLARLYYAQIFALHHVDTAKFDQTMNAYIKNPPALDSLYNHVIESLTKDKEVANSAQK